MGKRKVTTRSTIRVDHLSGTQQTQRVTRTTSLQTLSPSSSSRNRSNDRASPKQQSSNELEGEGAVGTITISTEHDRSSAPNHGGNQIELRDAKSNHGEGGPGFNDKETVPCHVESPLPKVEKTKGGSSSVSSAQAAKGCNESPAQQLPRTTKECRPKSLSTSSEATTKSTASRRSEPGTEGKNTPTFEEQKTPGPILVPAVPVESEPPSEATVPASSSSRTRNPQPSFPEPVQPIGPAVVHMRPSLADSPATQPVGKNALEIVQGEPLDWADPAMKDPSSAARKTHDLSYKSDIESLYTSPFPEKAATELEPIELDSDPDFEMMELMLLSHRGPSQSRKAEKEPTTQSLATRPLKRQRDYPSPRGSSQATAKEPWVDFKPAKRPRVGGPHTVGPFHDRKKHPEFWDLDGTVVLQIDDVLFRVMRSTLSKASPWFQRLFNEDFDNLEVMAGCPVYVVNEEGLSNVDLANLLCGLENGLEYALNPPHYLRIASIFRAATILEFGTLRRWSLGHLEQQWPTDLPPPSKPSKFAGAIPWAEETLAIVNQLEVPQLAKRAYWELCTRSEFGRIDAEVDDDEVEEIMPTRSRLPRSILMDLTRLRERLLPEWTRITRSPPTGVPCARVTTAPSVPTAQLVPCSLDYASWYRVLLEVEVNDATIDDRRMDPISALEVMIVEIDWEMEGGFCTDCVKAWKTIWTKDREKIWKNLGDWLGLGVTPEP